MDNGLVDFNGKIISNEGKNFFTWTFNSMNVRILIAYFFTYIKTVFLYSEYKLHFDYVLSLRYREQCFSDVDKVKVWLTKSKTNGNKNAVYVLNDYSFSELASK